MAQSLLVSGVEYIPALTAGKRFGYTREYILMLAREGKITAQKVNNRWFIDPTSLEQFCASTKETQKIRSAAIRKQRQAELRAYEEQIVRPAERRVAIVETIAIVVVGLAIGMMGYVGTPSRLTAVVQGSDYSFLERVAVAFYLFISPQETKTVQDVEVPVIALEDASLSVAIAPNVVPSVATLGAVMSGVNGQPESAAPALIVAPAAEFSNAQAAHVAESFSDPVTVIEDPEQPGTGIIVPHFRSGDGEAYRYLMVPLVQSTSSAANGGESTSE